MEKINLIPSGKTLLKQPRMTVFIPAAITGAECRKHPDKKMRAALPPQKAALSHDQKPSHY
ncbi:hypothetical protein CLOBOL_06067 [Enterocloster bolteae ATCC BAA-613]|uniref:Uncharacterized protein n=1 Tax=Enterocloster bolteae (strain ATCC BAA-613 / DSM 15670 / CCUG 46953 / JCM 12243 / WAL 16351) TaxID=411902 RepID=A8S2G3_ENTBW|nr:hypothetical protein CLOBOL_06067 [Enterocloster bolteae ATCC BAA-613]